MHIREVYDIYYIEVKELLEKKKLYSETQNQEIKDILKKLSIFGGNIKNIVFGPEITVDKIRTKSLGKMTRDLHKKLRAY